MVIEMSLELEPVPRSSLSDGVFEQLCASILTHRLTPGDTLPSERELATTLQVNRGAIREALKRLSQAGLVEQRHGGGTFVRDYRRSADLSLLPRLLFSPDGEANLPVARSIMEMRAALAPDIARLCAERRSPELLASIDEHVAQLARAFEALPADPSLAAPAARELEPLQLLSLELWDRIVQGADNIAYRLAFNTLRQTYEQIRDALLLPLAKELCAIDRYIELLDAIRHQDGFAAHRAATAIVQLGSEGMNAAFELLEHIHTEDRP